MTKELTAEAIATLELIRNGLDDLEIQLAKVDKGVCPECDGDGRKDKGFDWLDRTNRCPTCQGTGKKVRPELREKLRELRLEVYGAALTEKDIPKIIALMEGE